MLFTPVAIGIVQIVTRETEVPTYKRIKRSFWLLIKESLEDERITIDGNIAS